MLAVAAARVRRPARPCRWQQRHRWTPAGHPWLVLLDAHPIALW